MVNEKIGEWAFILGVVIAIITGLAAGITGGIATTSGQWIALVLVILGLVVGFLNIQDKDIFNFLIAAIALMSGGIMMSLSPLDTLISPLGTTLTSIFRYIVVFVSPAALIVALKAVYNLSKTPSA